jgi:hypothetical protein
LATSSVYSYLQHRAPFESLLNGFFAPGRR